MSIEERKIFVGNLHYNTTDFSFSQHFQMYGEIEDVVILREKNGRSRGCGFITYKEPSMAQAALSASTHIIDGRKVEAKTVIPRNANAEKKRENLPKNFQKAYEHLNKLYVSNLGSNMEDEQLKKYFLKYGKIQDAYIAKGPNRRSKGFGFIIFQNKESVEKVQNSRPHWICGKEIATMRGYPDHDSSENKKPSTKLFVMNYKDYIEVRDIEQYFKEFGVIVAVAYKMDTRENKKYTELEFEDYDIVDKIILNGPHTIRGCDVVVKKCLEVISEEQKKESVKKVEVSSKPSRNSSVSRENLKSSNRKQPMTCDKTQNLQKVAQALINKSTSSRRSSSLREHFDTSNKQMPDTPNETQNVQNTAPTPCAPPLEDLQNPGRNPSYPISYEAQQHRLYPTISNAEPVSSYPQNSYSNNYSSPNSFPIRNRTPIQRNQSQREEKNGCVIS